MCLLYARTRVESGGGIARTRVESGGGVARTRVESGGGVELFGYRGVVVARFVVAR